MRKNVFILVIFSALHVQAQTANVQAIFGIDGYMWNRTPVLDSSNTHIHTGNAILNPSLGISINLPIGNDLQLIMSSHVNYGVTSLSLSKHIAFGTLSFPNMFGLGFYAGDGVFTQILYGYQFNLMDLYGVNETYTRKELRYETHVIECSIGFGDDNNELLFAPYIRYGLNRNGAHSLNLGLRLGFGFNQN